MAAGDIFEYLNEASADYSDTQFDVEPQIIMTEYGHFRQEKFEYDNNSRQVITRSDTPKVWFRLKWDGLYVADARTIIDFYFDKAKGKGMARSFEFPHPTDGQTYVVAFDEEVSKDILVAYYRIPDVVLAVLGYVADSSSGA
jgi:hypothetical protein